MVKRSKTPEVNEEAKYYTCWKPYPNNYDFELDEHYIKFCRWIVNILGDSGALHAVYYKPKHGMVIFSVDKSYLRPERLLGEHRWLEFLKKPGKGEHDLVSKIFYSTYSTDRDVQKDGWKCIPVEDYFFLNWGIDKWFTKVPYPAPHWCDVPSENKVHKALCRTLPGAQVPKPSTSSPAPRPVPGSADYAQMKATTNTQRGTPNAAAGRGQGGVRGVGKGASTNKQVANPNWGKESFPSLNNKPPASKKEIPGLPSPSPASPAQSVWQNRRTPGSGATPSSPHRSALSPPASSTAHQIWANNGSHATQQPASGSQTATSIPGSAPAKTDDAKSKSNPKQSVAVAAKSNANAKKATAWSSAKPGKRKNSSSSSSSHSGSNTASPPSSVPSSPSLSGASLAASGFSQLQVNPNAYDYGDDYDDELTEETYHENWETASAYVAEDINTIAVRISDKRKGKSTSTSTPAAKMEMTNLWPEYSETSSSTASVNLWAEPEPAEPLPNLWANAEPKFRPTGRASAAEAWAKVEKEVLCPQHKGKCPRGVCKAYKEEKRRVDKLQRKKEKDEKKKEKRRKEQGSGSEEKEGKKVDEEDQKEDSIAVTPTIPPLPNMPNSSQGDKKMWGDTNPDETDSDIGDLPVFPSGSGGKKKFYDDEDFED